MRTVIPLHPHLTPEVHYPLDKDMTVNELLLSRIERLEERLDAVLDSQQELKEFATRIEAKKEVWWHLWALVGSSGVLFTWVWEHLLRPLLMVDK